MTEDQKYQGALYREKPSKSSKRKSVSIAEPGSHNALVPRAAYVEDDPDEGPPPAVPTPPPAAPAQPIDPVNVFDFLVNEETPNASRTSLTGPRESMSMKKGAPSVFSDGKGSRPSSRGEYRNREEQAHDENYTERGFSYGTEPVKPYPNPKDSMISLDFMTPSAKVSRAKLERIEHLGHSRTNSGNTSDKKRKRGQAEEQLYELEGDTVMRDTTYGANAETPGLAHSGLTGGLTRLLSHPDDPFPPSPDDFDERNRDYNRDRDRKNNHNTRQSRKLEDPPSPLKRTRHSKDDSGLGISIKGRAGKVMSMVGGASVAGALAALTNPAAVQNGSYNRETALVKVGRRMTSSSEDSHARGREIQARERKKHKVHSEHGSKAVRHERESRSSRSKRRESRDDRDRDRSRDRASPDAPNGRRKIKAIEYHRRDRDRDDSASDSDDSAERRRRQQRNGGGGGSAQMVVFGREERVRIRAESFLAVVTKGPESEKGYSINKALKRWHRDGGVGGANSKHDEEKELWRGLRLKKNERGEIVVFF